MAPDEATRQEWAERAGAKLSAAQETLAAEVAALRSGAVRWIGPARLRGPGALSIHRRVAVAEGHARPLAKVDTPVEGESVKSHKVLTGFRVK